MRRCLIPSVLTCIAFACGYPTYVGGDGLPAFDAGYVPDYEGGTDAGDSGSEPPADACILDAGTPPDFTPDKACLTATTCLVLSHQVDCCENTVIVGVDTTKFAEANALEAAWQKMLRQNCKACAACEAGPTLTEDGKSDAGLQLECTGTAPNGLCRTKRM